MNFIFSQRSISVNNKIIRNGLWIEEEESQVCNVLIFFDLDPKYCLQKTGKTDEFDNVALNAQAEASCNIIIICQKMIFIDFIIIILIIM